VDQIRALAAISTLGPQYADLTFDNYDLSWPKDRKHRVSLEEALEISRRFAQYPIWQPEVISAVVPFLTIMGKTGVGKTGLAVCMYHFRQDPACVVYQALDDLGQPYTPGAVFVVVPEMLDWLREGYDSNVEMDQQERIGMLYRAPFLILDDLGMERGTEFAAEVLDRIINVRSAEMQPTVVTTNLPVDDLPARIRSRLRSGILVFVDGEDYRVDHQGMSGRRFLDTFEADHG